MDKYLIKIRPSSTGVSPSTSSLETSCSATPQSSGLPRNLKENNSTSSEPFSRQCIPNSSSPTPNPDSDDFTENTSEPPRKKVFSRANMMDKFKFVKQLDKPVDKLNSNSSLENSCSATPQSSGLPRNLEENNSTSSEPFSRQCIPNSSSPDTDSDDFIVKTGEPPRKKVSSRANKMDKFVRQLDEPLDKPVDKPSTCQNKKKKRFNNFNPAWLQNSEFKLWLIKSSKKKGGGEFAECKVCGDTLSAHKTELKRHSNSKKHKDNMELLSSHVPVDNLITKSSTIDDAVKRAETKLAAIIAVNNLPFSVMDTLVPLCRNIFPDSKIAEKLQLKRTKTTSVVRNSLGSCFQNELVQKLKVPGTFFSIIMDETTDQSSVKQCALTVIYYDKETNTVKTNFLDMYEMRGSTSQELYDALMEKLKSLKIPHENMVGFSADTCNVMVGEYNSVFSKLKEQNPNIVCIKCSCHSIHLAASKACLKLPNQVEDLLRNLGAHFNRSYARQSVLKEIQIFFGEEIHKILSPATTRWLSLKSCVDRVIEQYLVLKKYLASSTKSDPSGTTEEMVKIINAPFTLVYLEFMSYVLGILTDFNRLFQSEVPLLHCLKPEVQKMLKDLCSNYLKLSTVRNTPVLDIDHKNPRHFLKPNEIYVGLAATSTLEELLNEKKISQANVESFKIIIMNFYVELVSEIKKRFTFTDKIFDILTILDPKVAQEYTVKSLHPILNRFPVLKSFVTQEELDGEWKRHALLDEAILPSVQQAASQYWKEIVQLKTATNLEAFPNLRIVISLLLILPFSNASVERVFSQLKLCKTSHRNKLKTETVVALMVTKEGITNSHGCVKFEPTPEMLNAPLWK